MLVIIGAFCTQDVPGGHACSVHSLMRCCSVCCEQSLCVDDMCIYLPQQIHRLPQKHGQVFEFGFGHIPATPQAQARRKLPALRPSLYRHQSCGSSFSSSTQRHCGLKFTLSCSFLPAFCIKVFFFLLFPSQLVLAVLVLVPKPHSWVNTGEEGSVTHQNPPHPSCMPNLCPVQQCLLCTGLIHAQIQTHKDTNRKARFPKHTRASQGH